MKENVLLIDDDETLCELGQEMFEILNIEAFVALDLEEALECYSKNHMTIKLVIFDLNLEQASGVDVYEALKRIDNNFSAILASGIFIDEDAPKYLEMGFKEIILKPYNLSTLKRLTDNYL